MVPPIVWRESPILIAWARSVVDNVRACCLGDQSLTDEAFFVLMFVSRPTIRLFLLAIQGPTYHGCINHDSSRPLL